MSYFQCYRQVLNAFGVASCKVNTMYLSIKTTLASSNVICFLNDLIIIGVCFNINHKNQIWIMITGMLQKADSHSLSHKKRCPGNEGYEEV